RHHLARKKLFKLETVLITLCHSEGRPFLGANLFSINMFMPEVTAFCYIFGEKCGLAPQGQKRIADTSLRFRSVHATPDFFNVVLIK
ncbi:MAG: hypothetical protein DMG84_20615, partial [Acidobacteria bacterium]